MSNLHPIFDGILAQQMRATDQAFGLLDDALANRGTRPADTMCRDMHFIRGGNVVCTLPAGHECAHGAIHLGQPIRWGDGFHCHSTSDYLGTPDLCINPTHNHHRHYGPRLTETGRYVHEWGNFRGRHMAEVESGLCDPDDVHDRAKETHDNWETGGTE